MAMRNTHTNLDVAHENALTTIRMSTETEVFQIHAQVSQVLRF